jgi:hypothetical protein
MTDFLLGMAVSFAVIMVLLGLVAVLSRANSSRMESRHSESRYDGGHLMSRHHVHEM